MNRDAANPADPSSDAHRIHAAPAERGSDERRLVSAAFAQYESRRAATARTRPVTSFSVPGYRILGEIHRGGQGVVYRAIQESTQRKMAIKVLKEGPFADRTELARFEREVDVLSRLKHPHIVAIHDRGLTAGHAYYVMDYIAGAPLDAYVAGADLSVNEVLRLFIKVCEAVNSAHLRGVIHRDLKPGNIRIDEDGEPRILDFGLAKLAQVEDPPWREAAEASSARAMTLTGQFVGSLPWSSPEQAAGRSDLIDIRTDVYSLGVILYELLTRHFPYPVAGRIDDVVRHIVQTPPARLALPGVEHDLELIVLKCLAKEPARRYQSAGELARDIRHYLSNEPIEATPASASYRFRKFVRRNCGAVLAGAVVTLTLLIAAGLSLAFGLSEARQRRAAESARGEAKTRADELEQVTAFQEAQLSGIDAQTMGVRLRQDLLEKARAAAERSKLPPDEVNARVSELEELIAGSDFTDMALEALDDNFFQPALAAIEEQFADQPLVKARLLQTLATTLQRLGLLDAASKPQDEALAIRRRELGDEHPDTLASLNTMGFLLQAQGKQAEAEPYFREALERYRRVLGDDHPDTLRSIINLGGRLSVQGKWTEAERCFREALEGYRRVLGNEHPDTLQSIDKMGFVLNAQAKPADAEPYYREALETRRRVLGNEHFDTLRSIGTMGYVLRSMGMLTEAKKYSSEALEGYRRLLGNGRHDALTLIGHIGGLLQTQGELAEAEPYYREALEIRRRVLGNNHPDTLNSMGTLSYLLRAQGKLAEAELYSREALAIRRRVLGNEHPKTLSAIINFGVLLMDQGKLAEAEPYCREVWEKRHRVLRDELPDTLLALYNLGRLLQALDKPAEVVELLAPAEPAARRAFTGGIAVHLGRFLTTLGRARVAIGEFDTADTNLSEAHAILSEAKGATERDRTDVLRVLVEFYNAWHTAEPDQGYDGEAAEWQVKLDEQQASAQPALP